VAFPGLVFYLFMPIGGLGLTCTFSFIAKGGFSISNCGFVFPPLNLGCPMVPTAIQATSHLLATSSCFASPVTYSSMVGGKDEALETTPHCHLLLPFASCECCHLQCKFTKTASQNPPIKNEAIDLQTRSGAESVVFLPATLCLPAGRFF